MDQDRCPVYASFFGMMGCSVSITLCCLGAAYGTAKSSIGISAVSVMHPDMMVRNLMPVVLSGILGIYGLVVSVIISTELKEKSALHTNFLQLGAGLSVGLSCLSAGLTIGIAGDAGVRGSAQQPRLFVGMMLILIFSEVLGIYGLIIALLMLTQSTTNVTMCI
ncbi:v-type proton ATPase proteolipid subunit-3 [Coleophoma cylindrospora]|uniref:V-type proton ATPase proteolipid subunit n=1 Tax=Coleophoma cylindrospora TaxID=1849047 RepID=A0A3D8STH6_9HELO|nr:v-type proton ATPase proteolipid subunit-3 [Coleophoma cylindrospora]